MRVYPTNLPFSGVLSQLTPLLFCREFLFMSGLPWQLIITLENIFRVTRLVNINEPGFENIFIVTRLVNINEPVIFIVTRLVNINEPGIFIVTRLVNINEPGFENETRQIYYPEKIAPSYLYLVC